jgi:hypothetical protein
MLQVHASDASADASAKDSIIVGGVRPFREFTRFAFNSPGYWRKKSSTLSVMHFAISTDAGCSQKKRGKRIWIG